MTRDRGSAEPGVASRGLARRGLSRGRGNPSLRFSPGGNGRRGSPGDRSLPLVPASPVDVRGPRRHLVRRGDGARRRPAPRRGDVGGRSRPGRHRCRRETARRFGLGTGRGGENRLERGRASRRSPGIPRRGADPGGVAPPGWLRGVAAGRGELRHGVAILRGVYGCLGLPAGFPRRDRLAPLRDTRASGAPDVFARKISTFPRPLSPFRATRD
jgi:hypothetical protein